MSNSIYLVTYNIKNGDIIIIDTELIQNFNIDKIEIFDKYGYHFYSEDNKIYIDIKNNWIGENYTLLIFKIKEFIRYKNLELLID